MATDQLAVLVMKRNRVYRLDLLIGGVGHFRICTDHGSAEEFSLIHLDFECDLVAHLYPDLLLLIKRVTLLNLDGLLFVMFLNGCLPYAARQQEYL